ncbi:hypothetical protein A2W24_04700 [Microgenomates group bacterium RBG_16_45_19]|nr:MAG: hypothetical protein A2W24_04700 [Microgenomates group bacterium RBG_16_45_19]
MAINLVSGRKQELRERQLVYLRVQFISMTILVVFLGAVLGLYGLKVYVAHNLEQINQDIVAEETAIAKLRAVEVKYRLLLNKLTLIDGFLAENDTILSWLQEVYNSVPAEIKLTGVTLDNLDRQLNLKVEATSMTAVIAFLDLVETTIKQSQLYQNIAVDSVTRNDDGSYGLGVNYTQ